MTANRDFLSNLQQVLDYHDISFSEHQKLLENAFIQWACYRRQVNGLIEHRDIVHSIESCIELHYYRFQSSERYVSGLSEQLAFADVGKALAYLLTMKPFLETHFETSDDTLLFTPYDLTLALDSVIYVVNNFANGADLILANRGFHYYVKELLVNGSKYFEELLENLTNRAFEVKEGVPVGIIVA